MMAHGYNGHNFFFHGQIGIHDTPLTQTLLSGDFKLAERILQDITDPEVLNDGKLIRLSLIPRPIRGQG